MAAVPFEAFALTAILLTVAIACMGKIAYELGFAQGRLSEMADSADGDYQAAPTGGHLYEIPRPRWL